MINCCATITGEAADEHRCRSDSPLSCPLVLLEALRVALDVDLLVVDTGGVVPRWITTSVVLV